MLLEGAKESLCRWVAPRGGENKAFSTTISLTSVEMLPVHSKIVTKIKTMEIVPKCFSHAWHTAGTQQS